MLSHENAVANAEQAYKVDIKALNWELDSHLGVLPMFHIYVCSNEAPSSKSHQKPNSFSLPRASQFP